MHLDRNSPNPPGDLCDLAQPRFVAARPFYATLVYVPRLTDTIDL